MEGGGRGEGGEKSKLLYVRVHIIGKKKRERGEGGGGAPFHGGNLVKKCKEGRGKEKKHRVPEACAESRIWKRE